MRQYFGDRFFYQIYFQTPGVAEHELQHDIPVTMRKMLYGASGAIERSGGSFGAEGAPPAVLLHAGAHAPIRAATCPRG